VAISAALALFAPFMSQAATAESAPRVAVAPTQAFIGSGTGGFDASFRDEPTYTGRYSSTGQMGSGSFIIDTGINAFAAFTRSDRMRLYGTSVVQTPFACGPFVQVLECLQVDVAGTADIASARIRVKANVSNVPDGVFGLATAFTINGTLALAHRVGYWMVDTTGSVAGFGGLPALGNAPTTGVTHLEPTPDHQGYWIIDSAGHVYAFGDAIWLGNAPEAALAAGETVTGLSATPSGHGYWLFTSRGRVLPFGDAPFLGDMHTVALNGPVIGAVATPTGHGYYMVASDGGVFTFGDAAFHGSMGSTRLNRPVNGLVPTVDNTGYWLVASDGGVFAFNAPFLGSMGNTALNQPVVGMTRYGTGYLMVARDGGLFNFSSEPFFGSLGGTGTPNPTVGVAATS
jgi:ribosomal protein L24E